MKKALLIGLPLLALLTAGLVYGPGIRDAYLLDGQAANDHRLRETATGGKPYHKPIQYRKQDARPAIVEPEFVDAAEAKIAGGTKGIGVSINGESRFYPLYVLQYHQVINDTIGNSAIACSY